MTLVWLIYDVAPNESDAAKFKLMGAGWRDAIMQDGRLRSLPQAMLVKEQIAGQEADFLHAETTLQLIDAGVRPTRLVVVIGGEHYAG